MTRFVIDDLVDPRLAVYRQLHRSNLTRGSGQFIAEGKWLVQRLAASDYRLESIVCGAGHLRDLPADLPPEVPVYVLRDRDVSQLIGFDFHRGMLACGRRRDNPSLAHLLAPAQPTRTVVVCPQVADPTNLGGIIRNGAAFGIDGLLLGPGSADPFSRRVVRVSMGSVLQLPVRESPDLELDLRCLRDVWGFELVGTVLDPAAEPLPTALRGPRLALLFGSEGHGLERRWIELCHHTVTLPMQRNTDSLNLATATGIFLYHFTHVASRR